MVPFGLHAGPAAGTTTGRFGFEKVKRGASQEVQFDTIDVVSLTNFTNQAEDVLGDLRTTEIEGRPLIMTRSLRVLLPITRLSEQVLRMFLLEGSYSVVPGAIPLGIGVMGVVDAQGPEDFEAVVVGVVHLNLQVIATIGVDELL